MTQPMLASRYSGRNVSAVKTHNIRAILLHLLYNEPAYRVKLARDIAVSTTTVTKLVEELIDQGLVSETLPENGKQARVGRPHTTLHLVQDARYTLGIHIGGGIYRMALVNLRNEILLQRMRTFNPKAPARQVFDDISQNASQLIQESGVEHERIIGVGVGAPGLINYQSGVIGYAKNQGWANIPAADWLSHSLDLPVIVENNVRAMALGEAFFGAGREVSSLLFMYGRLGVAAGIVVDNRIYRGNDLGAGEVGHTFLVQEPGDDFDAARRQTLEELVAAPALIRQACEIYRQHPDSLLKDCIEAPDDLAAVDLIFDAIQRGDPYARCMVEKSAHYLGLALANAINFLNPEMILLGGMFAQGIEIYLPIVRRVVDEMTFAGMGERVTIQATSFGWKAGLLGASALALTHFFYFPFEDAP